MKKVKAALEIYMEDTYFRSIDAEKARGIVIDGRDEVVEDLRDFLDAIPEYMEMEDCQYDALLRWIDMDLGYVGSAFQFSRETEIALLTYINSCHAASRR